jgi:hypothetical protein
MISKNSFNEDSLLQDIIGKWGEHGAHADLCRFMISEITNTRLLLNELVKAEQAYAQASFHSRFAINPNMQILTTIKADPHENEVPFLDQLNEVWDKIMALPWIEKD